MRASWVAFVCLALALPGSTSPHHPLHGHERMVLSRSHAEASLHPPPAARGGAAMRPTGPAGAHCRCASDHTRYSTRNLCMLLAMGLRGGGGQASDRGGIPFHLPGRVSAEAPLQAPGAGSAGSGADDSELLTVEEVRAILEVWRRPVKRKPSASLPRPSPLNCAPRAAWPHAPQEPETQAKLAREFKKLRRRKRMIGHPGDGRSARVIWADPGCLIGSAQPFPDDELCRHPALPPPCRPPLLSARTHSPPYPCSIFDSARRSLSPPALLRFPSQ
jgi:hypothetical protein